jgi:protein-S-isoprenylcysteine O-methyltransferase Ste14
MLAGTIKIGWRFGEMKSQSLHSPVDDAKNHILNSVAPKTRLLARLVATFLLLSLLTVGVIFLPAGSWRYWQGWVYLTIFLLPLLGGYIYFYKHDPQLLERRLRHRESVPEQKLLMRWSKPLFLAAFLLPGLDVRYGWSRRSLGATPLALMIFSQAMILAGMLGAVWVLHVNRFAARTIQVEAGQQVISTGPYRFVRHPLYAFSSVLCFFTPLALGSYLALPAFMLLLLFYALRLLNEEKVLREQLPGYTEYCLHTRFRLIPYLW